MGFGSKSRKEAKRQQEQAMVMQRQAFDTAQRGSQEYQANFGKRNAGIIGLQGTAQNYLERYNKGEDIASLNPASARMAQETAGQVTRTMQFASKLGDRRQGDADYQAKLNSVATRDIAKGLARLNEEGLMNEVNSQRGILMDTSNFLNADQRAGLGMNTELFNMTNSIFANATTKRNMEMQRSNMMMQNLMGFISGGLQGVTGVMTAGASAGLWGARPPTGGADV